MKKLLVVLLAFVSMNKSNAQITFISYDYDSYSNYKLVENNVSKKQLFNISFSDKIFIHNVFSSEDPTQIDVSQIYSITDMTSKNGTYYITVLSGVSGNSYYYGIKFINDKVVMYQYDDETKSSYSKFNGTGTVLKTFSQSKESD